MRSVLVLAASSLLCVAPCVAQAQERVNDVVDLQGVQSEATASPRSAFGRVMDVMIAKLVEQHSEPADARDATRPTALAIDSVSPRAAEARRNPPQIDIALGERFALPPAEAVTRASVPE